MKFGWETDFPSSTKRKFYNHAVRLLRESTAFQLSSILFGLKEMKYDWKNDGKLEQTLLEGIVANFSRSAIIEQVSGGIDLANCIYNLGGLLKERKTEDQIILTKEVYKAFWNGIKICAVTFNPDSLRSLLTG
jgi:hypothetical protein